MKSEIYIQVTEQGTVSDIKKKEIGSALRIHAGKRIVLTIERKYNKRSNSQNRFLHGVVIPIIQEGLIEAGWNEAKSFEWTKDFIKSQCLVREFVNEKTGEVKSAIGKTSELTTSEFAELIDAIAQWGAEYLGVFVPMPGEQLEFS